MTIQPLQLQLAEHLQTLSGEQVKALVVQWLLTSDATIAGLNQHLMTAASEMEFGEIDAEGTFHPLSEAAMVEQSLAALERYRQTGGAISHDRIQQWANSLDGGRRF
jgi:hypothetical protein